MVKKVILIFGIIIVLFITILKLNLLRVEISPGAYFFKIPLIKLFLLIKTSDKANQKNEFGYLTDYLKADGFEPYDQLGCLIKYKKAAKTKNYNCTDIKTIRLY